MAFRKAKSWGRNVLAFAISLAVVPFLAIRKGKVAIVLDSWKLAVMGRLQSKSVTIHGQICFRQMVDLWADGAVVNLSAGTIGRGGRLVGKQGRGSSVVGRGGHWAGVA